jgi:heme A synthase
MRRAAFVLSLALAAGTFGLIVVGGTVHPTGSSLACPDWPTCYGTFFPEMTGGVRYEHTHRLVATAVGAMTVLLAVLAWRLRRHDRALGPLGLAAAAMVTVQGVLGGVTVLLRLPLAVSAAHLALSMAFFLLTLHLAVRLWPGRAPLPHAAAASMLEPATRRARGALVAAVAALYAQVLLGALVRHTGSGPACGTDYLLCLGSIWPSSGPAELHMAHRFGAVVAFVVAHVAAVMAARRARALGRPLALFSALSVPSLLAAQIALGVLTVTTGIGLVPVTAHLAVGALLLGGCYVAFLGLGPLLERAAEKPPAAVSRREPVPALGVSSEAPS